MRRSRVAFALAATLYCLLTIALTWPLVLHPGSRVPNDLGDSLLNMFLLAWNAREVPFSAGWWNLPQFFPAPGVMAFSEHLLGLSLIGTPVIVATGNVLLAYNVAFFLSFPLCAVGAHLLTWQLTRRHDLALVAGLAYAFAPYRMAQLAHIQVLSSYWMPFSLLGLHLFAAEPRWRHAALFAGSWYLQALACGYYLFYLSVLVGLWLVWFALARIRWQDMAKLLAGWGVAIAALIPVALGYVKYQQVYGLRRWPEEIEAFSADIASVLTAPGNLRLWGWLNIIDRPESSLFPGATLVILLIAGIVLAWVTAARADPQRLRTTRLLLLGAVIFTAVAATPLFYGAVKLDLFGLRLLSVRSAQRPAAIAVMLAVIGLALHPSVRAGWRRRSSLAFYALAAVVMWLFSLGPAPTFMGAPALRTGPYAWLMLMPGVDGVRVPARFWVLATLCLAIAASLALGHLVARAGRLRSAGILAAALLIVAEAWPTPMSFPSPPPLRPSPTSAVARLELPIVPGYDLSALFRAAYHERPLVNGYSGYFAPHYGALQHLLARRDPAVLTHLASFGAIEVVVDEAADADRQSRALLDAQPGADVVLRAPGYTVYRVAQSATPLRVPEFATAALPLSTITASTSQDRVGNMTDGDLDSRWDTAGPQEPRNSISIDLGRTRRVEGVEMLIGGYVADFPRALTVHVSEDGVSWQQGWSGETALIAFVAALERPRSVPLRLPLGNAAARYVLLRQTGADRVYYWSIAELRVYGS